VGLAVGMLAFASHAGPSGKNMPVGDLPGWKQVFTDDFTQNVALGSFPAAVSSKWTAYPDGWTDNSGFVYYMPSKTISILNGYLDMYIHTENNQHMAGAILPKTPQLTYGRYTVCFRADSIVNYGSVWLFWPDSNVWPAEGEIDFPEGGFNGTMNAYAHYADPNGGQDAFGTSTTYGSWHVATTEWSPGKVVFILDGQVIGTSTTKVPSKPMHVVYQAGSHIGSDPGSAAGHVQVDWVAVYSYCPTCAGSGGPVANGTYKVIARHSGKGLDVTAHSTANGANVQQWNYNGGNNQRWNLTQLGNSQYSIIGVESGKGLDVDGSSTADGANVQIWSYWGGSNQKWTIAPTSGGYYNVRAVHSGKALDVVGASTADGANVQQWNYNGGNNQQWGFQAP
jgi:hypothetical protein